MSIEFLQSCRIATDTERWRTFLAACAAFVTRSAK